MRSFDQSFPWPDQPGLPLLSAIATVLAMILGLLCYLYRPYWSVRKVPGPPTSPLVGHLPLMAKYGLDVFSMLAKQYGPIYRFHMGRQPVIIIADAELCKQAGIKKFKDIPNRSTPPPMVPIALHQKGLFLSRDARWTTMRNTILSLYQPTHLASLVPTMQSFIDTATQNLDSSKEDIIFSKLAQKLATDVIGKTAFGVDFGLSKPPGIYDDDSVNSSCGEHQEKSRKLESDFIDKHNYCTKQLKMDLSSSFSTLLGLFIPILQMPFWKILKSIPGTMDWKLHRANRELGELLEEVVQKRMQERNRSSCSSTKDFLSLMLNARDSDSATRDFFTLDYVNGVTYEHLLAGTEGTAFTLSSVVYLVAQHPEVEKRLLDEIDLYGPREQMPTVHDLQHSFPYLDQVIKEAMRFYFGSPFVTRETSNQVEIGGYVLPKGTWVWLAMGVLAKDPSNFQEPHQFNPDRFDPNCDEMKRRHPYAFIPFGIGPRSCLGQKFALQEIKLSLIHLYRHYQFRHSPDMENPLELEYGVIMDFKHGVKLTPIKRTSH